MSLTKATYSMIAGAPANILDFGASPSATGSVNSAAIQAAIDSNAHAIYIPSGDYTIDTGLSINRTGLVIYGDGVGGATASILRYTGLTGAAITAGSTQSIGSLMLRDFRVTGRAASGDSAAGIVVGSASYYCVDVNISNVWVNFFTNNAGLRLNNTWWITITNNCLFENNLWQMHLPNAAVVTTLSVDGNTKLRNGDVGLLVEATTLAVDALTFNCVSFESTNKEGIRVNSPGVTLNLLDCYFEGNGVDPTSSGSIYFASTNTTAYQHATLHIERAMFHVTLNGPDLNLGQNTVSTVYDCDGLNIISAVSTSIAYFARNRGHQAGNPLAMYESLLGNIQAEEYDTGTGQLRFYNSLGVGVENSHLIFSQTTAPTVAFSSGQGTNATVTLAPNSTDTAGQVIITTTGATTLSPLFILTFNKAYAAEPIVVMTPASTAAQVVNIANEVGVDVTASNFRANVTSSFTTASVTLKWNYVVIGTSA